VKVTRRMLELEEAERRKPTWQLDAEAELMCLLYRIEVDGHGLPDSHVRLLIETAGHGRDDLADEDYPYPESRITGIMADLQPGLRNECVFRALSAAWASGWSEDALEELCRAQHPLIEQDSKVAGEYTLKEMLEQLRQICRRYPQEREPGAWAIRELVRIGWDESAIHQCAIEEFGDEYQDDEGEGEGQE
jgi:hypothetical protein